MFALELGSCKWLKGNPVNAGAIPVAVSLSLLATNCTNPLKQFGKDAI